LTVLNHEFRTPLTLVVAYAEMLKVDLQTMSEEELVSFLKGVNSGADRLRRLVENFILLAELENGDVIKNYSWRKRKIEDLTPILSNAHAQIFTAENAKHHCDFEVEGTLAPFVADGELLTMAVRELMDNAIKFSKDRTSDAVVSIKVGARSDDQWLYIWVEDHGRGIPHWEFDNIWKPFYQINREETEDQGAGSGLAIVKGVVDIHFGKTDVVSKVSQGSRFTIAIPLTQPDANSPEYLAADDSIAPGIISHNRVEVHLNAAQKAELQNYYRSASSREQQERVQCILLSNQGLQPDALSDVLLYPINTLNEWMARYNEGGLAKLLM
jgi:signal transduction histidine kinase